MKNDGIPLLSIEQAISEFEGQWKGRDFCVLTPDSMGSRRHLIPNPFRTDYLAIFIAVNEQTTLPKNALLMVSSTAIRDVPLSGPDTSVAGMIFTRHFLTKNGINETDIAAFDFFLLKNPSRLMLTPPEAEMLLRQMKVLQEKSKENKDKPYAEEVIRHHFMAFLYELAALYRIHTGHKVRRTRKEDLHLRFRQLLTEHVREERSVRFYASKLFLTPKYLTAITKEVAGQTAGEMIDDWVMREARNLLRDPGLSVSDVAGALHFSDQFFFRKFFKRQGGQTPSEFRKEA